MFTFTVSVEGKVDIPLNATMDQEDKFDLQVVYHYPLDVNIDVSNEKDVKVGNTTENAVTVDFDG